MAVTRNLDRFVKQTMESVQRVNSYVGERFVSDARQTNTYMDRTANLRNSIGYKTDGKMYAGGGEGGSEAKNFLGTFDDPNSLTLVAGMSYAAAVEAKGYDVISGSVARARDNHVRMLKKALAK